MPSTFTVLVLAGLAFVVLGGAYILARTQGWIGAPISKEEECERRGRKFYADLDHAVFEDGRSARVHVAEKCRHSADAFDFVKDGDR